MAGDKTYRSHGTGSVRWKAGAWRIQVRAGTDAEGKTRWASRTVRAPNTVRGRREAERAALELAAEVDQAATSTVAAGSYAELVEQWIEHKAPSWAEGSADATRKRLAQHVLPTLGHRHTRDITPYDLDALYRRLLDSGLSAASVRRIHTMIRSSLAQALRWRLISSNPATAAEPPSAGRPAPKTLATDEQARQLIALAENGWEWTGRHGDRHRTEGQPWLALFIRLAVHTGARRGELCRLRWSDVDLDHRVMVVWQTKTDRAKSLTIGASTLDALKAHRAREREALLAEGRRLTDDDWLFRSTVRPGEHVAPDSVSQAWRRLTVAAGLPTTLQLRHLRDGMATHLLTSGHDVSTVQGRGGWASPGVLLGVYAQRVTDADLRAADAMDAWLGA